MLGKTANIFAFSVVLHYLCSILSHRTMKRVYILLCAGLCALCACKNPSAAGGKEDGATYKTMTVAPSKRTLRSSYTAKLQGRQMVEVRPQVSGIITAIKIREGEMVRRGQTLFVIDQVPYKAALEVARANVKSAETKVEASRLTATSKQKLYDKAVISEYDLQMAKSDLASAEAALAQAKAQLTNAANDLSYTEVKSPVDGQAGMIAYRVGALVGSNITTPLVTVSDDSEVQAYFSMNENQVLDLIMQYGSADAFLQNMTDVEMVLSNGMPYDQKGRLGAVSGLVDAATGAVQLRADFPNPNHLLRNGASASVIIPTKKTDCLVIPQTATYEIQEKKFVFKVEDGVAHSTEVKVFKLNDGTEFVVESGLKEGDIIVAEGAGLMKDGTKVNEK